MQEVSLFKKSDLAAYLSLLGCISIYVNVFARFIYLKLLFAGLYVIFSYSKQFMLFEVFSHGDFLKKFPQL